MQGIGDHAIIGDGRSAALVGKDGAIDWLCWPRFDSPSIFASVLDEARGGELRIAPTVEARVRRRYVDATNVLETTFEHAGGVITLTDFMSVADDEAIAEETFPEHELVRIVECMRGEVEIEVHFDPRPGYGRDVPRIRDARKLGVRVETRSGTLAFFSPIPLARTDAGLVGRATLRAGESLHFSLTFAEYGPMTLPVLGVSTEAARGRTLALWRRWAARTRYDGPYRDAIVRSALALKLLAFAPSGAILAAPTTSLPECPRGTLNWDYRYCWLRDAAFISRALLGLGHADEAYAFVDWTVHTTALTRPRLNVMYDVYGERVPKERELGHLSGHGGARPIRIGNGARSQLQLDVYGEVIESATQFVRQGGELDGETSEMLVGFARYVAESWRNPDQGIWEPRYSPEAHVHSRVLCWTALDRVVGLIESGRIRDGSRRDVLAGERAAIREEVERRGFNPRIESFVQVLDGERVDAALLVLPWYGFVRADDARMRGTYRRIRRELAIDGSPLLLRYLPDESPDPPAHGLAEGAFGICAFWAAEYLALGGGALEESEAMFGSLLRYANDVGLFGEEINPADGAALGNFPQGFTHVGAINVALSIEERRRLDASRVTRRSA